jgi:hypothetical protein
MERMNLPKKLDAFVKRVQKNPTKSFSIEML